MDSQLVITCGPAAKLLEAAEEMLDGLTLGVAHRVVDAELATLSAGRNDGVCAVGSQGGDQRVCIVATVGAKISWDQVAKQWRGLRGVVSLARLARRG